MATKLQSAYLETRLYRQVPIELFAGYNDPHSYSVIWVPCVTAVINVHLSNPWPYNKTDSTDAPKILSSGLD